MSELNDPIAQARAAYLAGDWGEVERLARRALEADQGSFDALHLLGVLALQSGSAAAAEDLLRRALASNPASGRALGNLGSALLAQGRPDEALACLERAIALEPDLGALWNRHGMALLRMERPGEALVSCERAIALAPADPEARNNRGVALCQLQRQAEALASYGEAVALRPDYPEAWRNWAHALWDLGRHEEAFAPYERALALAPDDPVSWHRRGFGLQMLGRLTEALDCYERALRLDPQLGAAWHDRGVAQFATGHPAAARESLERALALDPEDAGAWKNLGGVLLALGEDEEALASYERALRLDPELAVGWCGRGVVLSRLWRPAAALASLDRGLGLDPAYAAGWNDRGNALRDLRRPAEALESYERALALKPDFPEAWTNRGNALADLGRTGETLASHERALALQPDLADAWNNRGNALQDLRRLDEALASYERALAIRPDYPQAWANRGNALAELGRLREALASYDRALAVVADTDYLLGNWLHTRMKLCHWADWPAHVSQLAARVGEGRPACQPFVALSVLDSPEILRRVAETWVAARCPPRDTLPAPGPYPRHERIRIGYFSADLRDHPVAHLTVGLFERHDRSRFHLTAFAFGPDSQDAIRGRLAAAFDRFVAIGPRSDLEVAHLAREGEIDIAVDLTGHTLGCRTGVFALRAAPIQVNFLGYAGTLGAPYIDYVLADRYVIPDAEREHYREHPVYLPDSYLVNTPRAIAERPPRRAEQGLPEEGFVFCAFNGSFKIVPAVFAVWMRLLRAIPDSVLWLTGGEAEENLRKEAASLGVAPERLVFAPRLPSLEDHLARYRLADLFLDTWPYNAHTTASDALLAGLPVLTCSGRSFAARVAGSLLRAIGLPELITDNLEDYEALALALARDPERLGALRQRLAANRLTHPLFDTDRFRRHIEAAYIGMWERCQRGEPPASFAVEPIRESGERHGRPAVQCLP